MYLERLFPRCNERPSHKRFVSDEDELLKDNGWNGWNTELAHGREAWQDSLTLTAVSEGLEIWGNNSDRLKKIQ